MNSASLPVSDRDESPPERLRDLRHYFPPPHAFRQRIEEANPRNALLVLQGLKETHHGTQAR